MKRIRHSGLTSEARRILIRLAAELVLYAVLVTLYLFLVLRIFTEPLVVLFNTRRLLFGPLALGLIVFQGFLLESFTTFLIDRLEL